MKIVRYSILFLALFLLSCSGKSKEDGWVKFDLYGNTYTINQQQFMIRANYLFGEGEKIKSVQKGKKITFEFSLGPTQDRAKKELEATGKQLKQLARGNIPEEEDASAFFIAWCAETTDPMETLKHKISYATQGLNLGAFASVINIPGYTLNNLPRKRHNCWVIIDEITSGRVKGKFGGTFEISSLRDISILDEKIEITNGTFDVPLKKLYRFR